MISFLYHNDLLFYLGSLVGILVEIGIFWLNLIILVYLFSSSNAISARRRLSFITFARTLIVHNVYMGTYSLNANFEWQFLIGRFSEQVYYSMVCHCFPRGATSILKIFQFCLGSNSGFLVYQISLSGIIKKNSDWHDFLIEESG